MRFLFSIAAIFLFATANARAGVLVQIKMMDKLGTIDVELFDQDKPATVENFIRYVKSGAWHDQAFHRWIAGFVLQGGSFKVPHRDDLMTSWNTDPETITTFGTIPFERDVGRFFSNTFGTLAMARVGTDTNSASASWFFNLNDNIGLNTNDGGYTVFGRTLNGTNILNLFVPAGGTGNIFNIFGTDVPVFSDDPERVNVYFITSDFLLLTAQIALTRGGPQISWNSVAGRSNIVEFTQTFPAQWQTLQTVTGTGQQMSVLDNTSSADAFRNYRIRIDYSN